MTSADIAKMQANAAGTAAQQRERHSQVARIRHRGVDDRRRRDAARADGRR